MCSGQSSSNSCKLHFAKNGIYVGECTIGWIRSVYASCGMLKCGMYVAGGQMGRVTAIFTSCDVLKSCMCVGRYAVDSCSNSCKLWCAKNGLYVGGCTVGGVEQLRQNLIMYVLFLLCSYSYYAY